MRRDVLLTVTAFVELGAALALLVRPEFALALLLGEAIEPKTEFVGRITGAALLAIAVACWRGRGARSTESALIAGALTYNAVISGLLAYGGTGLGFGGVLLWPAIVLHVSLTAWCIACLTRPKAPSRE